MTNSEARFTINVREGLVELEGKENFVDKHLEKFEEIFKIAVKEAIARGLEQRFELNAQQPVQGVFPQGAIEQQGRLTTDLVERSPPPSQKSSGGGGKHSVRSSITIHPMPVDLKATEGRVGLRGFYAEKRPTNHYEKTAVFVYYLTKFNNQQEVRFGEILSCYEEVNEKKPSIADIVKNSIRYKGWLEQGSEKYVTRLTISGENFVKFDLPAQNGKLRGQEQQLLPSNTSNS